MHLLLACPAGWTLNGLPASFYMTCACLPVCPPACLIAGSFLVETFRAMMPKEGKGRWCTRGKEPGGDIPAYHVPCIPKYQHLIFTKHASPDEYRRLFAATKRNFPANCAGFSTHQDMTFMEAVGVNFSSTLSVMAVRFPVDRILSHYYFR